MTRVQFDREQVLLNASNAFWRLGYHATSMQTVFEQTGLKPGSVYLAFGNKEGLFKASLDYYNQQTLVKIDSIFAKHSCYKAAIRFILLDFVAESSQSEYCSCFLVKSQLELNDHQRELRHYVSLLLKKVEAVFAQYLLKDNSQLEAEAKAASVMLHIFGIRVYGYHHQSQMQIIEGLRLGLPWLDWPLELH